MLPYLTVTMEGLEALHGLTHRQSDLIRNQIEIKSKLIKENGGKIMLRLRFNWVVRNCFHIPQGRLKYKGQAIISIIV